MELKEGDRMAASIMQTEKECYITGSRYNLDCHHQHCLHGQANRKLADRLGLWVWLRHDIHMRLHDSDKELDRQLQKEAQEAFEKTHTREEFRAIFGKSYL